MSAITPLRDLVEQRLGERWEDWSRSHPHLARVIDRTRLIETVVDHIRLDAEFVSALREADLDEARLAAAARVLALADRLIRRSLPF